MLAGWSGTPSLGAGNAGNYGFGDAGFLRNTMMEQALQKGEQLSVLELAQLAPGELRTLLQPFMGGQWQNDTPTLRIPYYRQLDPLHPDFSPVARSNTLLDKFSLA